jgi:signal transduction histidine kinase
MRLVPDSITSRLILILVIGMILTLTVALGVTSWGIKGHPGMQRQPGPPAPHYPELIERITTFASILNKTPPNIRNQLLPELRIPGMKARIITTGSPPEGKDHDWKTRHIQEDLMRQLPGRAFNRIEVFRGESIPEQKEEPIEIWIGLQDHSWFQITLQRKQFDINWLIQLISGIVIIAIGIGVIAVWAARRVTQPFRQFTLAATRLGTDVNAPPMVVEGAREIREAAHAFNVMQQRINRFVEDRTLMLAAISHDLRTSLTRLRLRAEYIADPEQKRKMELDLNEMNMMLEETLDFARADASKEQTTKVDIAALLESLCDDLADAGQAVRYVGEEKLTCLCRPGAMRRVLANLIDNAVRYGQEAEVDLRHDAYDLVISITDKGPGIPPDMLEKVFSPFFRLETSRSKETGGTGIGLAIARSIIRQHGGDIELRNKDGGGLVVKVTLPVVSR